MQDLSSAAGVKAIAMATAPCISAGACCFVSIQSHARCGYSGRESVVSHTTHAQPFVGFCCDCLTRDRVMAPDAYATFEFVQHGPEHIGERSVRAITFSPSCASHVGGDSAHMQDMSTRIAHHDHPHAPPHATLKSITTQLVATIPWCVMLHVCLCFCCGNVASM